MRLFLKKYYIWAIFIWFPVSVVSDEIVISEADSRQYTPAVATSPNNYLVVWPDYRDSITTETDIYAQLVSKTGQLIDSNFAIDTHLLHQSNPAVEWGDRTYMVVWHSREGTYVKVRGRFLDSTGTPVDTSFIISEASSRESNPELATNGSNFLVVWARNDSDVYGSIVSFSGGVIVPAFPICTVSGQQSNLSVASNGVNYLVVWEDERSSPCIIYGQRVKSDGSLIDTNFVISESSEDQGKPDVSSHEKQYLVVWEEYGTLFSGWDIFAQRIDTSGASLGDKISVCSEWWDDRYPSVDWQETHFLVIWNNWATGSNSNIHGQKINPNGTEDGPVIDFCTASANQSRACVACRTGGYLIAWEDERNDEGDIYGYIDASDVGIAEEKELRGWFKQLKVAPNPFSEKITIKWEIGSSVVLYESNLLCIYDLSGKLIETTRSNIVANNLKPGIYFLKAEGYKPVKIVKLK